MWDKMNGEMEQCQKIALHRSDDDENKWNLHSCLALSKQLEKKKPNEKEKHVRKIKYKVQAPWKGFRNSFQTNSIHGTHAHTQNRMYLKMLCVSFGHQINNHSHLLFEMSYGTNR